MKVRGVTLIELAMGLLLAAIVAAVVMTGAAALAAQARRNGPRVPVAAVAGVGDVLDAMLAEARTTGRWAACRVGRTCGGEAGVGHGVGWVAGGHRWEVRDGELRVCSAAHCEAAMARVVALQVFVDIAEDDGIRRIEAPVVDAGRVSRVELRLSLADGSQHARSAWVGQ